MTADYARDPDSPAALMAGPGELPATSGRRRALAVSLGLIPLAVLIALAVLYGMTSAGALGGCGGG
jgi:hypothetical protein